MQQTNYFLPNRIEHGSSLKMRKKSMREMSKRKKLKKEMMNQQQLSLTMLKRDMNEQHNSLKMLQNSGATTKNPFKMLQNSSATTTKTNPSTTEYARLEVEKTKTTSWLVLKEDQGTTDTSSSEVIQQLKKTQEDFTNGMQQQTELLQKVLSKFDQMESKIENMQTKFDQLTRNQDEMTMVLKNVEADIKSREEMESIDSNSYFNNSNVIVETTADGNNVFHNMFHNKNDSVAVVVSSPQQISSNTPDVPRTMPNSMSQLLMEHEVLYQLTEYGRPKTRKHWPPVLKACYSKRHHLYSLLVTRANTMRGCSKTVNKHMAAEWMDKEMQSKGFRNTDQYCKYLKYKETRRSQYQ